MGQGSPIQGDSPIWNAAFRCAGNPAHEPGCLLAYADHSAVGLFLSLELFCHLGIGYLLLHGQLFDSLCQDLVPPPTWRTLCPLESIVGALRSGLSASSLFAIVTRLIRRDREAERKVVHARSISSFALAGEPGQQNGLGPIEKIESGAGLARRFV
jgi:hypothetical protein